MLQFYPCFPINEQIDQTDYYKFSDGFDKPQVDSILKIANDYNFQEAGVEDSIIDNTKRSSKIKWLAPDKDKTEWIYEMIMQMVMSANFNLWKFDINHFKDSIQYTEYHSDNNGHYSWHMDLAPYPLNTRKISITVQLSDPSEYEGGDLQIKHGDGELTLPKEKGTVLLFPSYLLHRVTPVTKGVRKSLVLWVGGSTFR
jgi:PKHD-type hydroxylase